MNVKDLKSRIDLHGVASRLGIPEWPNRTGSFCSPLRPDRSESFSIFERDGELFFKDHATGDGGDSISLIQLVKQCDPKAAIEWMASEVGVREETKSRKGGKSSASWENRELVCLYDYRDAAGAVVHQTLRYRDKVTGQKTFLQRRRAKEGERFGKYEAKLDRQRGGHWIWNLGGIEPVLYRLPEILGAPDREVWLFEGEKDADNAAKMGLLSTTSPMGAGKWRASFTNSLRGRQVVICPDRDEPGTNHAVMVAKELSAAGCNVWVVDWKLLAPDHAEGKMDFTDWEELFLAHAVGKN
jgi:DNA primase